MGFGAGSRGALIAVLPLVAGGLVSMSGAVSGSAAAACAPSLTTATQHASAKKKPTIKAARPTIRKVKKHKYVGTIVLTVKQGSATVAATQSVCPDGTAGAAAITTQTASGTGVTTKSVSAKGTSKKDAKKAAKAKAKKVKAKLKKKGATKKGRKKAEARAAAAARPVAISRAHDALYLSDVVYVSEDSAGAYHITATPPAGQAMPALAPAAGGDITITVPAGSLSTTALPCVRRAPAWPTSFAFDGGQVVSPQLQAFAPKQSLPAEVSAVPVAVADGSTSATTGSEWEGGWGPVSSGGSAGTTTYQYSSGIDDPVTLVAGGLVCFTENTPEPMAYTATLHGASVGGTVVDNPAANQSHVVGGVPVALR